MKPGLTGASTPDLERLLRAVFHERVRCPFRKPDLHLAGFANLADAVSPLVGLERRAVEVTLSAVLAERRRVGPPGAARSDGSDP